MGEINLYQYPISPFSEKVRRVLTYKHLKWHPIDCHYEDKTNLLAITKGAWTRVPVLEWDGEVVYNSADIIKWLDRKTQARRVIPDDARGLIEIVDNWSDNTFFVPILTLTIPPLLAGIDDPKLKANREKLIGMKNVLSAQLSIISTRPRASSGITRFAGTLRSIHLIISAEL